MESFYTYILYSPNFKKIYIGQTSDLQKRLIFHNEILENTYTSKFRPWILIYSENHANRSEAMKREKQLKTSRGRSFAWEKVKEVLEK